MGDSGDLYAGLPAWVPRIANDARDPCALTRIEVRPSAVASHATCMDVTYTWTDERRPGARWIDALYRAYRRVRWGRTRDRETVRVWVMSPGDIVWKVVLPTIGHDGTARWTQACHHYSEYALGRAVDAAADPFVLYTRTWNHSLSRTPDPAATYVQPWQAAAPLS